MKKITITILAVILLVSTLSGQEFNKEANQLKTVFSTSEVYLLRNVYKEISNSAEEKWSSDYEMIVYHINEESKAFLKVIRAFSSSEDENLVRIIISSMMKWGCSLKDNGLGGTGINPKGADWRMILYTYENQKAAYLKVSGGR